VNGEPPVWRVSVAINVPAAPNVPTQIPHERIVDAPRLGEILDLNSEAGYPLHSLEVRTGDP
jgi:hypothetical protein